MQQTTYKAISAEENPVHDGEYLTTEEGEPVGCFMYSNKNGWEHNGFTFTHWLEPQSEVPEKRLVSTDLLLANHLKKEIEDSKNAKAVKELWDAGTFKT